MIFSIINSLICCCPDQHPTDYLKWIFNILLHHYTMNVWPFIYLSKAKHFCSFYRKPVQPWPVTSPFLPCAEVTKPYNSNHITFPTSHTFTPHPLQSVRYLTVIFRPHHILSLRTALQYPLPTSHLIMRSISWPCFIMQANITNGLLRAIIENTRSCT